MISLATNACRYDTVVICANSFEKSTPLRGFEKRGVLYERDYRKTSSIVLVWRPCKHYVVADIMP